jgi:hypothetical protein
MTADEVLAEFAKLSLTTRMRAAASVLAEATMRSDPGLDFWCEHDLLMFAWSRSVSYEQHVAQVIVDQVSMRRKTPVILVEDKENRSIND